jgi:hypothetical protein
MIKVLKHESRSKLSFFEVYCLDIIFVVKLKISFLHIELSWAGEKPAARRHDRPKARDLKSFVVGLERGEGRGAPRPAPAAGQLLAFLLLHSFRWSPGALQGALQGGLNWQPRN